MTQEDDGPDPRVEHEAVRLLATAGESYETALRVVAHLAGAGLLVQLPARIT